MSGRAWLIAGGMLSAAAALAHLGVILGGGPWYRFFGAGERMARLAEAGSPRPRVITLGIACVLGAWAAYGFAGAGLIPRLPLMRPALVAISVVYLARGLAPAPALLVIRRHVGWFWIWSSLIVLIFGLTYGIGTWRAWAQL